MRRSPGVLPITYTEFFTDEYDNIWEKTEQIGTVYTDDILKLSEEFGKITKDVDV